MEKKYGLRCANVFHAGDGNLHPLIMYDANQPGRTGTAEAFGAEILELSVALGGTITGEHGVGIEKINGIVSYEPTELVVTARCGTPLAELESALAERRQFLACEPPHFGAATVGGAVAAGLSGPRRAAAGSVRDFVLGVKVMDGEGRVLRFGGEVMKNVAGFDVSRLIAGSLGTLGLILEVSLKVLPLPVGDASLRFEMPQDKALEAMNRWAGQPLPLVASCWQDGLLTLRLSVHRRLKQSFDPYGVFNPGRLYRNSDGYPARRFHPRHAGRPEAEAILRSCVHCGFCTATCPTYQLLGDELDGPRGRIYLIKQVLEGAGRPRRPACTSTAA
jgi:FAD/FMN-containing dehydrogenase